MMGNPNIETSALVNLKPKTTQVSRQVVAKRSVIKINCGVITATSLVIQETCAESYMESLKGGAKRTNFLVIMDIAYKSQLNQLRIKLLGT